AAGSHADGIQYTKGTSHVARGNYFDMPHPVSGNAPTGTRSNAAIFVRPAVNEIDNVLIEGNWMNGGNYTIYVRHNLPHHPTPTNVRILDNRFGRDYQYGLYSLDGSH